MPLAVAACCAQAGQAANWHLEPPVTPLVYISQPSSVCSGLCGEDFDTGNPTCFKARRETREAPECCAIKLQQDGTTSAATMLLQCWASIAGLQVCAHSAACRASSSNQQIHFCYSPLFTISFIHSFIDAFKSSNSSKPHRVVKPHTQFF